MKRILYVLFLTILFIGCGQNDSIKQTGSIKEYHENGQLRSEGNYKDGLVISKTCWDENGNEIECE